MIVLDTTVLVYAKGTEHPLRDPCRALIKAIGDGAIEASTSVEVIQEFVHVRTRRCGRPDAVATGLDYAELLSPLLSVTRSDLQQGLALLEQADRLGAFDAVLLAAATNSGATALVSADAAFSGAADVLHVVPDQPGVAGLLGTWL